MRKLTFLFVLVSSIGFGQLDEVRRITETLCSPEFHGRGYVNGGDSIAAEFLRTEFEKRGLEKVGNSYFQEYKFKVNRFPGAMNVVIDGDVLTPGVDFVVDPSSGGTPNKSYELHFLNHEQHLNPEYLVSLIKELSQTDKKAVVFDLKGFSGDSLKSAQQIMYEVGTYVPIIEIVDTKFTWSVGEIQQFKLFLQVQREVITGASEMMIDVDADQYVHIARNVMAFLPAQTKAKKKKTIVFTAHYDHLGRMGMDTYFPGANDNASGTAMLFYLADHFKTHPIDANILFIAFSGEEAGLRGSKYYVEHPEYPLDKMEFLVNLDIMGSGEEGITVVNATLYEEEFNGLVTLNEESKYLQLVKKRGPAANSDHYWFTEKGVPAFFIYTMGPNKHYHDVEDTYQELSFSEFEDIGELLVKFTHKIIENQ